MSTVLEARYLYLRRALPVTLDNLGTGKTVSAKFCEQRDGDPADIGSLTKTLTEDGTTGDYAATFSRTELLTDLAPYVGKFVYLHLDDGVVYRAVRPFLVVDTDPDLLGPIRG